MCTLYSANDAASVTVIQASATQLHHLAAVSDLSDPTLRCEDLTQKASKQFLPLSKRWRGVKFVDCYQYLSGIGNLHRVLVAQVQRTAVHFIRAGPVFTKGNCSLGQLKRYSTPCCSAMYFPLVVPSMCNPGNPGRSIVDPRVPAWRMYYISNN